MRSAVVVLAALALTGCGVAYNGEPPVVPEAKSAEVAQVVDLSTDELSALLAEGNIRLIDVRRDDEVAEGIIPGAEHVMLDDFDPEQLDLSDGREIVLYCRSGRRSGMAAERLAAHTGEPAKHLESGIIAWREAELPTTQP